jgi:hypothetical protein
LFLAGAADDVQNVAPQLPHARAHYPPRICDPADDKYQQP